LVPHKTSTATAGFILREIARAAITHHLPGRRPTQDHLCVPSERASKSRIGRVFWVLLEMLLEPNSLSPSVVAEKIQNINKEIEKVEKQPKQKMIYSMSIVQVEYKSCSPCCLVKE